MASDFFVIRSLAASYSVLALVFLAAGCSKPTTGTLTGTVKVDGQPAKEGAITLIPVDGKGRTAGGVIKDGQYSATASLGQMKVEIRVPKIVGEEKLYDIAHSPMKPKMQESLPKRYNDNTELTVEVTAGEVVKNFDLK